MRYLSEIFWRKSQNISGLFPNYFEFFYVCHSVSWLTFVLISDKYRDISTSWWEILLIFLKHSWEFVTLVSIFFEFPACPSVCLLAYFITERAKFWLFKESKGAAWQAFWPSGLPLFFSSNQPYKYLPLCPLSKCRVLHLGFHLLTY